MRRKSTAIAALLLMLVLLASALGIGAYKGWAEEYRQVLDAQSSLVDMLTACREVAYNIATVAKRHISPDDPLLQSIRESLQVLESGESLPRKAAANQRLAADAQQVLTKLESLSSVQNDERDSMYVENLLPQALEQSAQWTQETLYNQRALSFNKGLQGSFSGMIARLLGVKEAEFFLPPGEDKP